MQMNTTMKKQNNIRKLHEIACVYKSPALGIFGGVVDYLIKVFFTESFIYILNKYCNRRSDWSYSEF